MRKIVSIQISSAEADYFRDFLPNLSDPLPPGTIGLTAEADGAFAGTALAISHPRSGVGSISVLHVPEAFRNLGVGERLLYEAERQLAETGCRVVRVTLTQRQGEPCLEKDFLHKRGYISGSLQIRSYTLRSADHMQQRWLQRLRLPQGARLKPLLSVTPQEREQLEQISSMIPAGLYPFEEERLLHPQYSTLLQVNGQIAGWLGVQRLASNLLSLRSLYVKPGYGVHGSGLALFAEVNRLHGLTEHFAHLMLSVPGDNTELLRLADRKLAPHASKIKSVIRLEKRL
ncbi:GNAT family N-acetyltransferase [Saccharibacillus sacchari]|uniref:GNAT family N-acetyltransferase n=1 Tax=Saccharibacillus sacchari TaxID=456493 RepID=A0ACC6PC32_9BACL